MQFASDPISADTICPFPKPAEPLDHLPRVLDLGEAKSPREH